MGRRLTAAATACEFADRKHGDFGKQNNRGFLANSRRRGPAAANGGGRRIVVFGGKCFGASVFGGVRAAMVSAAGDPGGDGGIEEAGGVHAGFGDLAEERFE